MMNYELEMKRCEIESQEKWRDVCKKMPSLHFKEEWEVKIIPPFGGALARFIIAHNNKYVSVYYDEYSRLGWMCDAYDNPIPYFELYPNANDDVSRYYLNETEEMMKEIEELLK